MMVLKLIPVMSWSLSFFLQWLTSELKAKNSKTMWRMETRTVVMRRIGLVCRWTPPTGRTWALGRSKGQKMTRKREKTYFDEHPLDLVHFATGTTSSGGLRFKGSANALQRHNRKRENVSSDLQGSSQAMARRGYAREGEGRGAHRIEVELEVGHGMKRDLKRKDGGRCIDLDHLVSEVPEAMFQKKIKIRSGFEEARVCDCVRGRERLTR
jgi:hypothetical protein